MESTQEHHHNFHSKRIWITGKTPHPSGMVYQEYLTNPSMGLEGCFRVTMYGKQDFGGHARCAKIEVFALATCQWAEFARLDGDDFMPGVTFDEMEPNAEFYVKPRNELLNLISVTLGNQ